MLKCPILLNVSSLCWSAAAGHKTCELLLRILVCPLLPDGASDHAVAALDVRGHDPLYSSKHLAHPFIQGKNTLTLSKQIQIQKGGSQIFKHSQAMPNNIQNITLEYFPTYLGTSRPDRCSPSVC